MTQIRATIHHFNLSTASAEWQALHANLSAWGYSEYTLPPEARYAAMPPAGDTVLDVGRTGYIDSTGNVLHDWTLYPISPRRRVGYWIELPPGCKPHAPDPAGDGRSRISRAIEWLRAEEGRTQTEAAKLFGVKQSNLSVALRKGVTI